MKRRTGALSNDVTEKSNQNTTWVNSIKRSKDAGVLSKDGIFSGITACILPVGMGKTRLNVFKTIIVNNGGQLLNTYSSVVTHVIADDCVTAECLQTLIEKNSISKDENYPLYVRTKWLSDCIKMKERLDAEDYIFKFPAKAVCKETVQSIQKDTSDTSGGLVFSSNENKASISQNDVCMSTKLIAPNDDKVPGLLDSHSQSNGSNINKVNMTNRNIDHHFRECHKSLSVPLKFFWSEWNCSGLDDRSPVVLFSYIVPHCYHTHTRE